MRRELPPFQDLQPMLTEDARGLERPESDLRWIIDCERDWREPDGRPIDHWETSPAALFSKLVRLLRFDFRRCRDRCRERLLLERDLLFSIDLDIPLLDRDLERDLRVIGSQFIVPAWGPGILKLGKS